MVGARSGPSPRKSRELPRVPRERAVHGAYRQWTIRPCHGLSPSRAVVESRAAGRDRALRPRSTDRNWLMTTSEWPRN